MIKYIVTFAAGVLLTLAIVWLSGYTKKTSQAIRPSKIVYSTTNTEDYFFPTHNNLLVMDRAYAEVAEVFVVEVETDKFTHRHIHNDTEQLYYILSGEGKVEIERDGKKEEYPIKPTEVIHIPRNCYHQTFCIGSQQLRYLAVDCFPQGKNLAEPTWDDHARAICEMNSWNYNQSRIKE